MPFHKINAKKEIEKAIKKNPELAKEINKVEKEFEELKLKCDSKNCTGQCEICECNEEETCGNPYSDLWVQLKWTIEGSEYCKAVREEDTAPAFGSALCQKCIDKKCRFIDICIALYEMNQKDHEEKE